MLNDNGIDINKFTIKYLNSNDPVNEDFNYVTNPIVLEYKGDYTDYFEPYKTKVEFIAGNGLELYDNYKNGDEIVFVKEKILANTPIKNYIFNKYKGLKDSNCTIEYKDINIPNYVTCEDRYVFYDGQNIKITINEKINGFTKKKVEKCKINVNFEVKDPSKYVIKTTITNISSLEIEKGKTYDYLITEINKHLGKNLKTGFKIYKNTKDPSNEFTDGLLENNTNYIVVFDKEATDFIKEKEKNKLYINLKFEVTDNTKYKLKQDVTDKNNIDVDQDKKYSDLLAIIKHNLGGKDLKDGFKIYKNDKSTEFTTGNIEKDTTYIVVFDKEATDFVDKKEEPKKQDPPKTQETTDTEQNNNDDNEKNNKRGCSGKNVNCYKKR